MFCIAAACLGVVFHHQIAIAVAGQRTPLTQLFFSGPKSLPESLSLSRPNRFGFTVVNQEGHDTGYSYVVTLANSSGTSTIAHGHIDLGNTKAATRLVNVRPTRHAAEYLITVELVGRAEAIQFEAVSK
jgi:hypothetical protein